MQRPWPTLMAGPSCSAAPGRRRGRSTRPPSPPYSYHTSTTCRRPFFNLTDFFPSYYLVPTITTRTLERAQLMRIAAIIIIKAQVVLLFYFLVDYISFSESTMKPNRLQLRRSIFRINAQSKTKNNSFPIGFGILSKLRTNIHSAQVWTICTHFICLLKISTQRRDSFVHTRKYHINVINVYIQICT